MAGFVRRFGSFPGVETITQIEGVVTIDQPPPGAVQGVGTGVVAMAGEFPDMSSAVTVSSSGVVATLTKPVEVLSGKDLTDKLGGFDPTIGDTGDNGGNGFLALRNKRYSRLIVAPVNLASGLGVRAWRVLPPPTSATQPQPIVPLVGGVVDAGREFKTGTSRVRIAQRINFTARGAYKQAIDGATTAAGAAATQTFNSATGGFLTAKDGGPVKKGDILVFGIPVTDTDAGTYRVAVDAASNTALTIERLDGASFAIVTDSALPYRIHPAGDADSAGVLGDSAAAGDVGGYRVPARPLDATVAAGTLVPPVLVPPAVTATSWDSLSGLTMRIQPGGAGLVFDSTVQAPNAVNHANLDALYATAIDALDGDTGPERDTNIVFSARTSTTIRTKLRSHVLAASENGLGRMAVVSPGLQTVSLATVTGDADPGVGAVRHERAIYSWPGLRTFVPEAVNISMGVADGSNTTDGILDTRADAWLASVLSNLAPERNPGQTTEPVPTLLAPVAGLQRSAPTLAMPEYISLRQAGICAPRIDRTAGPIFQSGITTSLISGQKNINRRRMADFIEDSGGAALIRFSKEPLTQANKDAMLGELDAFLAALKSENNPAAARITDYQLDDESGNTPDLEAQGIHVIISRVRLTPTADFIVIQHEIGEGVVIPAQG